MTDTIDNSRSSIIEVVTAPLGFFALCLLVVEGFLGITLIYSNLDNEIIKLIGMGIGGLLFLVVVTMVFVLVIKYPMNLTFGEQSWLKRSEIHHTWGTSDMPETKSELEMQKATTSNLSNMTHGKTKGVT